jgi:hypothetical protein
MAPVKHVRIFCLLMMPREHVLLTLAQPKLKSFRLMELARRVNYTPTLMTFRDHVSQKHAKSQPKFSKLMEPVRVVKTTPMQMTSKELA